MSDEVTAPARRRRFEDDQADLQLAKVRERIRKNFPDSRAPLTWRRQSPTRMVSSDNRFAIDKLGDGDSTRYNAVLLPHTLIGHRRFTLDQAKEDCCRHASPLPLEPPATQPPVEREPGSDDE